MSTFFYCDWCGEGEYFERVDTIIYLDNHAPPSDVSVSHICQKCANGYGVFVESRDNK